MSPVADAALAIEFGNVNVGEPCGMLRLRYYSCKALTICCSASI